LEKWPPDSLEANTLITYEEIAAVTGISPKTNRFTAVTNAWRKKLQPLKWLKAIPGTGFRILDEPGKCSESADFYRSGMRKVRKAVIIHQSVDVTGLDEDSKKRHDVTGRFLAAVRSAAQLKGNGSPQQPSLLE
jgi:hypothetical protein